MEGGHEARSGAWGAGGALQQRAGIPRGAADLPPAGEGLLLERALLGSRGPGQEAPQRAGRLLRAQDGAQRFC